MNDLVEIEDVAQAAALVAELEPPGEPLTARYVEILHAIGRRIRGTATRDPSLVSAAYWLRKANLLPEVERASAEGETRPQGLVFHVAPANVETMFLYSWAAAFLTGNASVVRLSQTRGDASETILDAIANELDEREMHDSVRFVTYDSSRHELTAVFSEHAQVRMIWGGDETIRRIRELDTPLISKDLLFGDRVSAAVIDASALDEADEASRAELVERFVADAWTFWQKACSSPHRVFWLGRASRESREAFWHAVEAEASRRVTEEPPMLAMNRLVESVDAIMDGGEGQLPHRLARVESELEAHRDLHPGGGFFVETEVENIDDLASHLSANTQTLSYWGLDLAELRSLPVDRIVTVGNALQFDLRWDGYDLLSELVRHQLIR